MTETAPGPTTGLVICSAQELFDAAGYRRRYLESLDSLTIDFQNNLPIPLVRHILSSSVNITDLVLLLPPGDLEDAISGLRFQGLEFFKTNIPHRLLVPFLAGHPSLRTICLGPCGGGRSRNCPLKASDLTSISIMESPCGCIPDLGHPGLTRLTLEGQGDTSFNAPAALKSLASPLPNLFSLVLDFHPNDYDILDSITQVAPNLLTLKLLEKPLAVSRREIQSRRAWNDSGRWFSSLLKLGRLEELALRTASRFIRPASTLLDGEEATLMTWVTRHVPAKGCPQSSYQHPAMTSLRVWYKMGNPGVDIITIWSKSGSGWHNIWQTVDPPLHALF